MKYGTNLRNLSAKRRKLQDKSKPAWITKEMTNYKPKNKYISGNTDIKPQRQMKPWGKRTLMKRFPGTITHYLLYFWGNHLKQNCKLRVNEQTGTIVILG